MVTAAQIHLSPSGFDEIVTGLLARAQHSAYTAVPDWRLRGPPCRARPVRRSSAGTLTISLDYDPKFRPIYLSHRALASYCTHVRHQSLTRQDLSNGFLEARCSVEQQAAGIDPIKIFERLPGLLKRRTIFGAARRLP